MNDRREELALAFRLGLAGFLGIFDPEGLSLDARRDCDAAASLYRSSARPLAELVGRFLRLHGAGR